MKICNYLHIHIVKVKTELRTISFGVWLEESTAMVKSGWKSINLIDMEPCE